MYGDLYREPTHTEMQQLIWFSVDRFADKAEIEERLPNGRIADIIYTFHNTTVIVEVKTELKQSLIQRAYNKYYAYCDYLVMATPERYIRHEARKAPLSWRDTHSEAVGIWRVTWEGIEELHPASAMPGRRAAAGQTVLRPLPSFAVIGSPACTARTR